jgi:hypothetical protein
MNKKFLCNNLFIYFIIVIFFYLLLCYLYYTDNYNVYEKFRTNSLSYKDKVLLNSIKKPANKISKNMKQIKEKVI